MYINILTFLDKVEFGTISRQIGDWLFTNCQITAKTALVLKYEYPENVNSHSTCQITIKLCRLIGLL